MKLDTIDGELVLVSGGSRSGKTTWATRAIKKFRTVLAWDPQHQWRDLPGFRAVMSFAELREICLSGRPGKFAYCAPGDRRAEFDRFCMAAYIYAKHYGPGGMTRPGGSLAIVAEELAHVTNPGKSSGNWNVLVTSGLKYGPHIYAISQRWQEADKTAFDNGTVLIVFMTSSTLSSKYFADRTRIPLEQLESLQLFDYLVYHMKAHSIERGRLTFAGSPGKKPEPAPIETPPNETPGYTA